MNCEPQQVVLLVSNDGNLCAAVRHDLETRCPDVRVSLVNTISGALQIARQYPPNVVLLAEDGPGEEAEGVLQMDAAAKALVVHAPVVVIGRAERGPRLIALIGAGLADYVAYSPGCMTVALGLVERRLLHAHRSGNGAFVTGEEWPKDFAELLRHELNNPLTGILGNAELLVAEINRKKDGQLPQGGLERVETIAALAMRMRETVRQLSHEWEARNEVARLA
ncbi:MAG TPA: histidine kinase dimerization/phospho-acceptor domain-containing protein [Candidatus Acidoferrum sp.]